MKSHVVGDLSRLTLPPFERLAYLPTAMTYIDAKAQSSSFIKISPRA